MEEQTDSTPAGRDADGGVGGARTAIAPTHANLEGARATEPLTRWLIEAAWQRGTLTYGRVKARLESECRFGAVFPVAIGRVAGAAMDRMLERDPTAPLLNVLLVGAATGLPGAGAAAYLRKRHSGKDWLRRKEAHRDKRWRALIEDEARRVYAYRRWGEIYRDVSERGLELLKDQPDSPAGKDRSRGKGGEGPNHRALKLRVFREPDLVQKGLRADIARTEEELLSGDRVDVLCYADDRTVAIEVKSRDSDWADFRRGVYQCVKYQAVLRAQDIRHDPNVQAWLVTEGPLPGDLKELARRLGVRTKVVAAG